MLQYSSKMSSLAFIVEKFGLLVKSNNCEIRFTKNYEKTEKILVKDVLKDPKTIIEKIRVKYN